MSLLQQGLYFLKNGDVMNNIFISYRREDSEGFARGLFQSLVGAFGANHVFMDVEDISLGADFVDAIDNSLASCGALIVLIGVGWVSCTDTTGRRRLDDPHDFVRMEVAKALQKEVRVIPVLVKGATMPAPDSLPAELQPVTRRQALELRHERWNQDLDHLVSALARELGLTRLDRRSTSPPPTPPPTPPSKKSRWGMMMGVAAVTVIAMVVLFGYALMRDIAAPPEYDEPVIDDPLNTEADDYSQNSNTGGSKEPEANSPARIVPTPKPTPRPQVSINLSGMWVDDEGINVQISHQGNEVVSQAYNPLTGLAVNSVWQVDGRRIAFNWVSNAGNQGYGDGTISADGAIVDYRYVDNVTGEQGYGRLFRTNP